MLVVIIPNKQDNVTLKKWTNKQLLSLFSAEEMFICLRTTRKWFLIASKYKCFLFVSLLSINARFVYLIS